MNELNAAPPSPRRRETSELHTRLEELRRSVRLLAAAQERSDAHIAHLQAELIETLELLELRAPQREPWLPSAAAGANVLAAGSAPEST